PADRLRAADVERAVAHDLEQPGPEAVRPPTLLEALQRREERVLTDILGVRRLPQHAQRDGVRRAQMASDELLEGGRLASARALDQAGIGITHRYTLDTGAMRNVEDDAGNRGAPAPDDPGRHAGTTASQPQQ